MELSSAGSVSSTSSSTIWMKACTCTKEWQPLHGRAQNQGGTSTTYTGIGHHLWSLLTQHTLYLCNCLQRKGPLCPTGAKWCGSVPSSAAGYLTVLTIPFHLALKKKLFPIIILKLWEKQLYQKMKICF